MLDLQQYFFFYYFCSHLQYDRTGTYVLSTQRYRLGATERLLVQYQRASRKAKNILNFEVPLHRTSTVWWNSIWWGTTHSHNNTTNTARACPVVKCIKWSITCTLHAVIYIRRHLPEQKQPLADLTKKVRTSIQLRWSNDTATSIGVF